MPVKPEHVSHECKLLLRTDCYWNSLSHRTDAKLSSKFRRCLQNVVCNLEHVLTPNGSTVLATQSQKCGIDVLPVFFTSVITNTNTNCNNQRQYFVTVPRSCLHVKHTHLKRACSTRHIQYTHATYMYTKCSSSATLHLLLHLHVAPFITDGSRPTFRLMFRCFSTGAFMWRFESPTAHKT